MYTNTRFLNLLHLKAQLQRHYLLILSSLDWLLTLNDVKIMYCINLILPVLEYEFDSQINCLQLGWVRFDFRINDIYRSVYPHASDPVVEHICYLLVWKSACRAKFIYIKQLHEPHTIHTLYTTIQQLFIFQYWLLTYLLYSSLFETWESIFAIALTVDFSN